MSSLDRLTSAGFFDLAVVKELKTIEGSPRHSLVNRFWPESATHRRIFDEISCETFLGHVANELDQVRHHRADFAAQNFNDTFDIIRTLRTNKAMAYESVVTTLNVNFPGATSEKIRRSVELSVRMWLTINVHTIDIHKGPIAARDSPLDWAQDVSLEELLKDRFGCRIQSQLQRKGESVDFDPKLTVAFLVNTCGMRLSWTDDIAGHLAFDPRRRVLSVYRHKACLISHADKDDDCPIPRNVLEEALQTMDILFPQDDPATKELLIKEGQQSLITLGCRRAICDLNIVHYQYFGEALEDIMTSFNQIPRTWKQLAFDRRNKLEWSAFWMTVFVAILTLVSIPCNIIQATYSVKAYNLAVAQGRNAFGAT